MKTLLLVAALTLAIVPAGAGEKAGGEKKDTEAKVWTNADLERLFGPPASREAAEGAEVVRERRGEEALAALEPAPRGEEARKRALEAARSALNDARARVTYLEQKLASIRNPYLPKPTLTKEDEAEEAGLDGVERLRRTESQIEEAREGVKRAEQRLERLEAPPENAPEAESPARGRGARTVAGDGS